MKKNITIIVLLIIIVSLTIFSFIKNDRTDIVGNTLKCGQLYDIKKAGYWGDEIGQSKFLYNEELNTCLALNIYNSVRSGRYYISVMDMSNDKDVVYYSDEKKGFYIDDEGTVTCEKSYNYLNYQGIKEYGCEKFGLMDKAFEKARGLGFSIFAGGI